VDVAAAPAADDDFLDEATSRLEAVAPWSFILRHYGFSFFPRDNREWRVFVRERSVI
jgi:hypothetical protein